MSRMDVLEKNVLFHCTHPQRISLRRKYAFLLSQDVSAFLHQENKKLHFLIIYDLIFLILLYERASSHTS